MRSRWLGLLALWTLWFLAPFVRRVLDLTETTEGPDLLAVAPFVATAVVALVEYTRRPVAGRAWVVPAVAAGGFAIGIPQGFGDPNPLAFGFGTYLAGLTGFFIGYAEELEPGQPLQLERLLLLLVPLITLYAVYQSLFPLPAWDDHWLKTVDIAPFGSKEAGNFRTFGTLNAPGALGAVLAVFGAVCLAGRRVTPYVVIVGAIGMAGMALTYVRSAWLALVFAMLLTVVLGRGRYIARVLGLATLVLALILALGPHSTIGAQVVERATTLGQLGTDTSAQARLDTTSKVLPVAIRAPIGAGLGAVGQARHLSAVPDRFSFPDNGYLAILYEVGPIGFLMIVGALVGVALWSLTGPLAARWRSARLTALVALGTLLFLEIGADVLYGVTAPMAWYFAGVLMRLGEKSREFGGG
jgi:putative inorganic carbon (hco3(-)) transporter